MKSILCVLSLIAAATAVHAGTPVPAVDKDLGNAMDKAAAKVEEAAARHGTCVSSYPDIRQCVEVHGHWQCAGIRANHKGSCANKPQNWQTVLEAAKGLTGPTAKATALGKLGVK